MSELTPCNFCTMANIRRRHPDEQIVVRDDGGWTGVYVGGKRVASFMELTKECVC